MDNDHKNYYVYIVTNSRKTTLYIGVTNNLPARLREHWSKRGSAYSIAGKYFCFYLIYYESYQYIEDAIARETEIKKWNRKKKEDLINIRNPQWLFLNKDICGHWPPEGNWRRF